MLAWVACLTVATENTKMMHEWARQLLSFFVFFFLQILQKNWHHSVSVSQVSRLNVCLCMCGGESVRIVAFFSLPLPFYTHHTVNSFLLAHATVIYNLLRRDSPSYSSTSITGCVITQLSFFFPELFVTTLARNGLQINVQFIRFDIVKRNGSAKIDILPVFCSTRYRCRLRCRFLIHVSALWSFTVHPIEAWGWGHEPQRKINK